MAEPSLMYILKKKSLLKLYWLLNVASIIYCICVVCTVGGSASAGYVAAVPAVVAPWGHSGVQGLLAAVRGLLQRWKRILWRGGRGGSGGRRGGDGRAVTTSVGNVSASASASTQQQLQGPVDQRLLQNPVNVDERKHATHNQHYIFLSTFHSGLHMCLTGFKTFECI